MAGFSQLAGRIAQQRGPVLRAPAGAGKSSYTGPAGFAQPRVPVIGPPGGRLQGPPGPAGFAPRPVPVLRPAGGGPWVPVQKSRPAPIRRIY